MDLEQISNLSTLEKCRIIQAIWDDLHKQMEKNTVSQQVCNLLDTRLERITRGTAEVHDWDSIKYTIEKR